MESHRGKTILKGLTWSISTGLGNLTFLFNYLSIASTTNSVNTCLKQVHYLLGWSLLLMRLQALQPLSPPRERILQFTQESNTPSILLECLFQHIPLDLSSGEHCSRVAFKALISRHVHY